jgi:hypothetical protein
MIKKVKPALPPGFKAISGGGDSWKPDKAGESIMGNLIDIKKVHFDAEKKGKKVVQEARDVNVYTIRTKDGEVRVWHSAGLAALAKVKKGCAVFIQYLGTLPARKGRSGMRDYLVATK